MASRIRNHKKKGLFPDIEESGIPAPEFLRELARAQGWDEKTTNRRARLEWGALQAAEGKLALKSKAGVAKVNYKVYIVSQTEKAIAWLMEKIGSWQGISDEATLTEIYKLKKVKLAQLCEWALKHDLRLPYLHKGWCNLGDAEKAEWGIHKEGRRLFVNMPRFRKQLLKFNRAQMRSGSLDPSDWVIKRREGKLLVNLPNFKKKLQGIRSQR